MPSCLDNVKILQQQYQQEQENDYKLPET
jgi:hypothetical protein